MGLLGVTEQEKSRSETAGLLGRDFPEVGETLLPDPAQLDSYQTWSKKVLLINQPNLQATN